MSVHPIRLLQAFHTTWFTVEGQVVELYERRDMESVLKDEKLIEAVRLFPCLWQVNSKSYKDAVAKGNTWKEIFSKEF